MVVKTGMIQISDMPSFHPRRHRLIRMIAVLFALAFVYILKISYYRNRNIVIKRSQTKLKTARREQYEKNFSCVFTLLLLI